MNKLVGTKADGTPILVLVLEPGNIHKILQGEPIVIRLNEEFLSGVPKKLELSVLYSETPVADFKALSSKADIAFDERTPISISKRPHCPECHSIVEQIGLLKTPDDQPGVVFCSVCGSVFGVFK